jgi:hypothetical protein
MSTCNIPWRAPRVELPESVDVNHICNEERGHRSEHRCSCGAVLADLPISEYL